MKNKAPFYITTPIYYVNDSPHIGHAYTTIACDVMARFMRLDGHEVKFTTGTDDHGQKVEKSANKAGKTPKKFTDEVSQHFRDLVNTGKNLLNVSNDDFIRTTDERHRKPAQEIWKRMEKNGHIYLDKYSGWYSVRDEAYYQESELIDGKAPTGADVEWVEEESYFFDLSKWQKPLLKLYKENPQFITPQSRYNEVVSFVEGGLRDLSISRTTFNWGIPVPGNDKHVIYVWVDALTNYLTLLGWPGEDNKGYKKFWSSQSDISPMHVVGKDIIRFHAVYWPAFLMAAKLPLPKRIVAHGWWTIEGEKMSKSLGNVISPQELIDAYGLDQTRYFLMREVPFGNDGNFSKAALVERVNSDLANNIGNLAQRVLSILQKNCDGKVPTHRDFQDPPSNENEKQDFDLMVAGYSLSLKNDKIRDNMHNQQFHKSIESILAVASMANEYIDRQAPWKLKKDNPERMGSVLYVLVEVIRCIAIAISPFMPASAAKILDQLCVPEDERRFINIAADSALKPGTALPAPQGVFPRIEVRQPAEKKAVS